MVTRCGRDSNSTADLRRLDRELVWHAFTQMAEYEPLIIQKARGCTLVDVEGRELLDGVSSLWCNIHGHRHPRLDQAIRDQLEQVAHVTSLGMSNPTTIELAQRLVEITPNGLQHVFFSSDGASSVEVALKMAFQYWKQRSNPRPQKTKYIALADAYHGDTLGSVSVSGVARFHEMFQPLLFDVHRIPAPDSYRLPNGVMQESALDYFTDRLRDCLEAHHEQVGAVVLEPLVQAAAGMVMHPPGFLRRVRELTQRFDVLLIADEITVGMGRTGTMFACDQEEVSPDLLCLGKGLSGGYLPVSATLATTDIWNAFLGRHDESKTLFHGHTYGGNPLGAAVSLATLDVFEEERTLDNLTAKIDHLARRLEPLREQSHVGDVRQRGLIAAVELVQERSTKQPYAWSEKRGIRVCQHALEMGVWVRPLGNVVVIMPPLAVELHELDRIVDAVAAGVNVATG